MDVNKQLQAERAAGVGLVARLSNYVVIEVAADGACKPALFRDGGRINASWLPMSADRLLRTMPQIIGEAIENAGGPPYAPPQAQAGSSSAG